MVSYCEPVSLISLSSLSNIAYFVSAFFAFVLVRRSSLLLKSLPILILLEAIGSMLWHSFPNVLTNLADTVPIVVFVLLFFYHVLRASSVSRQIAFLLLSVLLITAVVFVPVLNSTVPYVILLVAGSAILFRAGLNWLSISMILLFSLSIFLRTIDLSLCHNFPLGTHFLWHILNAVVFYLAVKYSAKN